MSLSFPLPRLPGMNGPTRIIDRRHPEHKEFEQIWRWLLDSLEGGRRYRDATYQASDGATFRNLIPHAREMPRAVQPNELIQGQRTEFAKGLDESAASTYLTRLARTPVPAMVAEVVEKYLSRVYAREIKRTYGDPLPPNPPTALVGPTIPPTVPPARPNPPGQAGQLPSGPPSPPTAPPVIAFPVQIQRPDPAPEPPQDQYGEALADLWNDCDGAGTTMDDWMSDTIAPLLVTLGCLDCFCVERPAPIGVPIESEADVIQHGLDQPIVGFLLPENMLWWRLDPTGQRYVECLTREFHDGPDGQTHTYYRHWESGKATLYDGASVVVAEIPLPGDEVPIVRLFDRKKFRTRNVGQSRLESVAEIQRDYYNRDSELILADIMQASPPLSGPVDFMQNAQITVGPGWVLPKFPNPGSGSYEGWEYVTLDKSGDESIRKNLDRRRDEADRVSGLTKPAGASGTGNATVSQSGVSKQLDQEDGNNLLGKISRALARSEDRLASLYLRVRFGTVPPEVFDRIKIVYPTRFNLYGPGELMDLIAQFQRILAGSGTLPTADGEMLQLAIRQILAGFDDDAMRPIDDEIDLHLALQAHQSDLARQGVLSYDPAGSSDQTGGTFGYAAGPPTGYAFSAP